MTPDDATATSVAGRRYLSRMDWSLCLHGDQKWLLAGTKAD
jgi:hypothetical protein